MILRPASQGLRPNSWLLIGPRLGRPRVVLPQPWSSHATPIHALASTHCANQQHQNSPTAALGAGSDVRGGGSASVVFFATCHPGLEQVVASELLTLGYRGVEPSKAGVTFWGRCVADGYRANMWLRSAIRVLVLLAEGQLGADPREGRRGGDALYDMVYHAADWQRVIPPGATFSVEPRLWSCTDLSSTRLVWSRAKDAVCDSVRDSRRSKPPPPERGHVADVPLFVSCYRDTVKIFRDMSGDSLHRRGYRDVMHRAALNEAAAAGVLALSGWRERLAEAGDGDGLVLADPMCGSATILIEAAWMARDIAPGLLRSLELGSEDGQTAPAAARGPREGVRGRAARGGRRNAPLAPDAWPFQRWDDHDAAAWDDVVEEARERVKPPWKGLLLGVDVHEGALSLAARQAKMAGVGGMLQLTHGDCGSVVPAATPQMVVCNPPWGGRLYGPDGDGLGPSDWDADAGRSRGGFGSGLERETASVAGRDGLSGPSGRGRDGGSWPEGEADGEGDSDFLEKAWRSLDGFLYRHCPGASATVVSGKPAAFRYLKLKPSARHKLVLSGVDVQVATYMIRDAASRVPRTRPEPSSDADPPPQSDPAAVPTAAHSGLSKGPRLPLEEHLVSRAAADVPEAEGSGRRWPETGVRQRAPEPRRLEPVGAGKGEGRRAVAAVAPPPPPPMEEMDAYDDYFVKD